MCAERAWSAPQGAGQNAPVTEPIAIVRQESNIEPDGTYQYRWNGMRGRGGRVWTKCFIEFFLVCFSYETANGIQADETGTLKKATSPDTNDVIIAQGKYSYTAPDGTLISITYVADDVGGFQPQVPTIAIWSFDNIL